MEGGGNKRKSNFNTKKILNSNIKLNVKLIDFFGFVSSSEFDFVQIVYEEIKVELIPANAIPSKMSGDASYLLWP